MFANCTFILFGYYNIIPECLNVCVCTDVHMLPNFILDRLFLLRAVARHWQQIVDIAKDLPLKDTGSCYKHSKKSRNLLTDISIKDLCISTQILCQPSATQWVIFEPPCREISPLHTLEPTDFRRWTKNHNKAKKTNVFTSKLGLERRKACDLSEGVSQVTVNDPVIQMGLLIKKFTYLVAEGKDRQNVLNLWPKDTCWWTKLCTMSVCSYAQFGFLSQHQQPLFIKLDHTPNLQQLQQNLHRTRCFLLTSTPPQWQYYWRDEYLLPLGVTGVVIWAAQKLQDL